MIPLALLTGWVGAPAVYAPLSVAPTSPVAEQLAALEKRTGGRLGVYALDTGTKRRITYRSEERFAMCSTFKVLLVAAVLTRVDEGRERLDQQIPFTSKDLLEYAPIASQHLSEGSLSLEKLCEAAVTVSDNTAANLLLARLGGPKAVTDFARRLGDVSTRLDRNEPTLNMAIPGDPRDTTTPKVMVEDLQKLLLGAVLQKESRQKLEAWMIACTTGTARLRAGIPKAWKVGDKTGSGENGTHNDIAILWPPSGSPILVAVYLTDAKVSSPERNAAIAEVARILVQEWNRIGIR